MAKSDPTDTDVLPPVSVSSVPRSLVLDATARLGALGGPARPTLSGLFRAALAALAGMPPADVISQAQAKRATGDPIERIRNTR